MTVTTATDALAYYAGIHAALFPIPVGSKNPTGIVESFKRDHSTDPKQWAAWQQANPGCNFGVVAFASKLIIVDIDVIKIGREAAWAAWCSLCADWGIEPVNPHVQSARGGWHVLFQIPDTIDPTTLRQPDAIKDVINVRCIGYVVAAGSTFEGKPYILLSDAAPYPAPAGLIEHCTRRPKADRPNIVKPGRYDIEDAKQLYQWLLDNDAFTAYEDWVQTGMVAKVEWGDAGLDVWRLVCHDQTIDDASLAKWDSFSYEATGDSVALGTLLKRAHDMGWRGQVRKSLGSMFGEQVAQIAAAAGASLPGVGALPMLAGQQELARLGEPILADFMAATTDAPTYPPTDIPLLSDDLSGHGLFPSMQAALKRVFALAGTEKFKPRRIVDPLALLLQMHMPTHDAVCRRLQGMGINVPHSKIRQRSQALEEQIARVTVTFEKWEYDAKSGAIESDNPDNVRFGLEYLGIELRWNGWVERMQVKGYRWPTWTNVDDAIVVALLTRFRQTKTRFRPPKEFLWDTLLAISHENKEDPALILLNALEQQWDGVSRLSTWLPRYCKVPCDLYHQEVGKLIVGGMVKRVRHPGCKFDFMPIFYGPQGTGKSTMARVLASRLDWFTDTIMLGDASKELILSLSGKMVVEISEMGMRGNVNVNHVKAMISRQVDAGRTAYARAVSERPRRNIFIGTTNEDTPLSDPTGNRRFLPIAVADEIDLSSFVADVGQLIGEAAALESKGATFDLPREVWGAASEQQESARVMSPLEEICRDWFDRPGSLYVYAGDLMNAFRLSGLGANTRPGAYMKKLGWRAIQIGHRRERIWIKHTNNEVAECVRLAPVQPSQTSRVEMRMTAHTEAVASSALPPPIPSR